MKNEAKRFCTCWAYCDCFNQPAMVHEEGFPLLGERGGVRLSVLT